VEAESEGRGGDRGGGIPLMMLLDSDNYCDKIVIKSTQKEQNR